MNKSIAPSRQPFPEMSGLYAEKACAVDVKEVFARREGDEDLDKQRIARHPSADLGKARQALRDGAFDELADAIRNLAAEGSATNIALTEVMAITSGMTPEEQIKRAADALIRAYLPESWERVVSEALRLEQSSSQPDFALAVRIEVERRRNEQNSG